MKTVSELEREWEKLCEEHAGEYVIKKNIYVVFMFFENIGVTEPWKEETKAVTAKALESLPVEEFYRFQEYYKEVWALINAPSPTAEEMKEAFKKLRGE